MSTELVLQLTAAIAPTITVLLTWLNQRSKTRKEQIRSMRCDMVQIYQRCHERGFKTQLDINLFYEAYDTYTNDLKQNSYISKEVEPNFKKIKEPNNENK